MPDHRSRIDHTQRLINEYCSGVVLDLCSGSKPFRVRGYHVCVDWAYTSKPFETSEDLDLVQACVESLPFRSESVDSVIFTECIEHLLEPEEALREIRRVLKRLGYIVISTPESGKVKIPEHLHDYTLDGLLKIVSRHFKPKLWGLIEPYWIFCICRKV